MTNIRQVKNLPEAESFWRTLSPQETIFDEWDFRYSFYKYAPHPLCFLVALETTAGPKGQSEEKAVGLLPLQRNPQHGYEFFAEDPCEENRPFVIGGYEKIIPDLYAAIPGAAKCYDITGTDEFTISLPLEDYKYLLPLEGLNNFSDFLEMRLSSKRRRSILKEIETIAKNNIKIKVSDRSSWESDLEILFVFNNNNFAAESYLKEEERAPWRDLLLLPYDWRLVTLQIAGVTQAVSLSVLYKKEWHYLVTGVNFKKYPSLGKYLVKANMEAAIAAQAKIFDAGLGDCGWKHLWHFDKKPQYEVKKSAAGIIQFSKS